MTQHGYAHFADALVFVHGPHALAEATRHAQLCMRSGDQEMAAHWLSTIEYVRALRQLEGKPRLAA
jgi:hypothetical protein